MAKQPADAAPGEGFLVLWVGGTTSPEDVLQRLLRSSGIRVVEVEANAIVAQANKRAPDLILIGSRLGAAPDAVTRGLRASSPACLVPIVTLAPAVHSAPKLRARFGVVARLNRDAAPAELAPKIVKILRGLSRRPPRFRLETDETKLPTLIAEYGRDGREGLFVAPQIGAIAIANGGRLAAPIERMLEAVRLSDGGDVTFYERAPGKILLVLEEPARPSSRPRVFATRILVIDERAERGGGIAATLQDAGAEVRVVRPEAEAIRSGRSLDPSAIVVSGSTLLDPACRPLALEARLAAATLIVLGPKMEDRPRPDRILKIVADACAAEISLAQRLRDREALAERLETLGPARWLKILGRCPHDVSLRIFSVTGRGRIDLTAGKIKGASFRPADARAAIIEGRAAIQAMLGLPFGRVLAGPPELIDRLEGTQGRKPSGVGRVQSEPSPTGPAVVKKELVVKRLPHDAMVRAPKIAAFAPPRAASSPDFAVPSEEDDASDGETAAYQAGTLQEKLRQTLRSDADAPTVPQEATPTSPPPREHETEKPAPSRRAEATPSEAARSEQPRHLPPAPARDERARRSSFPPTEPPPPARAAVSVPDEELIETGLPDTATAALSPPRPRPNVWFVLAVVVAVATGGWAAWRMGAPPDPTPSARPAPEVAEVPEVEPLAPEPVDRPSPEPEPAEVTSAGPQPHRGRRSQRDADELLRESEAAARERDFERSETLARRALDRDPGSAQAMYRIAASLLRQRRHADALAFAERAHEAAPRDAGILVLKAHLLVRLGRQREAIADYERCLQLSPGFEPAQQQLARLRHGDEPTAPVTEPDAPEEVNPPVNEPEREPPPPPREDPPREDPPREDPPSTPPGSGTPANPYG